MNPIAQTTEMPWDVIDRHLNSLLRIKTAIVLHGGPGSGKTWVSDRVHVWRNNPTIIDSDMEKRFDRQRDGETYADYHVRMRDLSRTKMEMAIARGDHLYIEGLSHDPRRTILVLSALRDARYHVVLVGLQCSRSVADRRLRAREESDPSKRKVPDAVFSSAYDAIPSAWARFAQLVNEFYLFDTSGDLPVPCSPVGNLTPLDPPKSLREAIISMLPNPYADLADIAVRMALAVGRARV